MCGYWDLLLQLLGGCDRKTCDKYFIYENTALPPCPLTSHPIIKLEGKGNQKRLLLSSCLGPLPPAQRPQIYNQIHPLPSRQITLLLQSLPFSICKMWMTVAPSL